jgi:hypothetical protein
MARQLNLDVEKLKELMGQGLTRKEIGKVLNVRPDYLTDYLKLWGIEGDIKSERRRHTVEEDELLKSMYYSSPKEELLSLIDRSWLGIGKRASDLGLKRDPKFAANKTHSFDEYYFKSIDTPSKAYFLGLLYADGCNSGRKLMLCLEKTDKHILERLREEIKYTGELLTIKGGKYFSLQICSKELSKDLTLLGVMPAKTFKVTLPKLSEELISHFIRGFFDGDGHIGVTTEYKKKNRILSFTGYTSFLEQVRNLIVKYTGVRKSNVYLTKKNSMVGAFTYSKIDDLIKIREWMYKDCEDFYLIRKKEKFDLVLPIELAEKTPCKICGEPSAVLGMCRKHYHKFWSNNNEKK